MVDRIRTIDTAYEEIRKNDPDTAISRNYIRQIVTEGYIYYQGVYDSLAEELAEEFDESVELINSTIKYLNENKLITLDDEENTCYLPEAVECLGSETASAARMRNKRKANKVQNCSGDVQQSSKCSAPANRKECSGKKREQEEEKRPLDLLTAEEQKQVVAEMVGKLRS